MGPSSRRAWRRALPDTRDIVWTPTPGPASFGAEPSPPSEVASVSGRTPPGHAPKRTGKGAGGPHPISAAQRHTIASGILCIVLLIVILQLWLLTATVNAWLGGDTSVIIPAAFSSLFCLGLNCGLLAYLLRLESQE